MKKYTQELNPIEIDYCLSQIDPLCEGLTFEIIDDIFCGTAIIENDKAVCIHLVGSGFLPEMKARRNSKFKESSVYNPTHNLNQANNLIEKFKCGTIYDENQGLWFSQDRQVFGETYIVTALKSCVLKNLGTEVEIPENIHYLLQKLAPK